jgi:hypothetical protein
VLIVLRFWGSNWSRKTQDSATHRPWLPLLIPRPPVATRFGVDWGSKRPWKCRITARSRFITLVTASGIVINPPRRISSRFS